MFEDILVNKLRRRDLGQLLLIAKVYYPREAWLNIDYLKKLERKACVKLAISWSGRFLGAILISPDMYPHFWLDLMVVDKNMTRRTLGKKLLLEAQKELPKDSALWTLVPKARDFAAGQKFLGKMGFAEKGHLQAWFAGGKDAAAFCKIIK